MLVFIFQIVYCFIFQVYIACSICMQQSIIIYQLFITTVKYWHATLVRNNHTIFSATYKVFLCNKLTKVVIYFCMYAQAVGQAASLCFIVYLLFLIPTKIIFNCVHNLCKYLKSVCQKAINNGQCNRKIKDCILP